MILFEDEYQRDGPGITCQSHNTDKNCYFTTGRLAYVCAGASSDGKDGKRHVCNVFAARARSPPLLRFTSDTRCDCLDWLQAASRFAETL
jgi:hypothetical protein